MDLLIKVTNQITVGNIMAVSVLMTAIVTVYYKIRRVIAKQHYDFVEYVKSLTVEQTARLEECIHKIPSHPENNVTEPVLPDSTIVL